MALSSAEKAAYRTFQQAAKLYGIVVRPEACWTCRVNGAHDQGAMSITYDAGVDIGALIGPDRHFTLLVGSSSGARDIGVVRYRSGAVGSSGTLLVDKNNIVWSDDDYITIIQEVRAWVITPDVTNTYEDEDQAYTDQNEDMHPLVWLGPPAVVFLDSAYVDVEWWADAELTHCGGAITNTSWTWDNGAEQGGSGTEIDPKIVRYTTIGVHMVACTKTHSNGKTHTRYSYTIVLDRDGTEHFSDMEFDLSGDFGSHGSGVDIQVISDADETWFPDGSMFIAFLETWYGGTKINYGGNWTYRENILYVGWIVKDSVNGNPQASTVTFNIESPAGMELECWPAALHYDGAAEWHRIPGMATGYGCAKAMFHLISEHSCVDHMADVHLPTNAKTLLYVDISESILWDQLESQIGECIGAVLAFDRQGALYIEQDAQIMAVADRAGLDTMFEMALSDWTDLELGSEDSLTKVAQIDFIAFQYDAGDPSSIYCLAPARQYSYGSISRTRGIRADSQAEANTLSGLYLARDNAEFQDNKVTMAGQWLCFDIVPQRYFDFPLDGSETERGLVWTYNDAKMLPRGHTFTWNAEGFLEVVVSFAQYAEGPTGSTGDYPDIEPLADPDPIDIPAPYEPPVERGWPDVCIFPTQEGGVWYTTDFSGTDDPGQPTWSQIGTGGVWPVDDKLYAFAADNVDPLNNMYAVTTTDRDVILWDGTTWSTILSRTNEYANSGDALYCGEADATASHIWVDRYTNTLYVAVQNLVISAGVVCVYKSIDNGSSWTFSTLEGPGDTSAYGNYDGGANVMAYNNHVAIGYCTGLGGTNWTVWYSVDGGNSWLEGDDVGGSDYAQRVFVPQNTTEFLRRGTLSGGLGQVYSNAWTSTSVQENTDYLWDNTEDDCPLKLWGNATGGTYRAVWANELYVTTDSFANYTNKGELEIPGYNDLSNPVAVAAIAYQVNPYDDDMIVYWTRDPNSFFPHCVFVADGENDVTPEYKSGSDCVTPDGNSIPYTAKGGTYGGPQFFYSIDIPPMS